MCVIIQFVKGKKRRNGKQNGSVGRRIILRNVVSSFQDQSYTIIDKYVDELLKDPELREKIDYHTKEILRAIAEKL